MLSDNLTEARNDHSNSLSVSRNQLTVARLDTEHNNVIHMSQFPVEEDGVYKYPLKLIGISPTGLSFLEEIPQSTPVSSPAKSNELNKCRLGKKEGQRRPVRKKYKFKNRHTSSGLFKDIVSKKITSLNSINEINSEQSTLSETDDKDLFFFDLCGNISNWDLDKTCEGNSNNSCSEKNYQFSNERRNISNETQDIVRGSPVNRTNQKMISKKNYRAIESEQMKNTRKRNNSGDCILIFTSSDEDEQMKKNNCDTLFGKRKKRILDYKIQEKSLTDEMSTNSFSKPRKRRKNKNTLHNSSNSLEAEKLETTICIDTSESEIELSSTKKNRRHSSFANEYGARLQKTSRKEPKRKTNISSTNSPVFTSIDLTIKSSNEKNEPGNHSNNSFDEMEGEKLDFCFINDRQNTTASPNKKIGENGIIDKQKSERNIHSKTNKNKSIPLDIQIPIVEQESEEYSVKTKMKRNKKLDRIGKQELEKKLQIQSKIERKKKYKESVSLKETINNILQENSQVQLKTKRKKKLSLNNVSFSSDILREAPEKKSSKKSSTNVSLEEIVNEMSNDNEEEFEENPQVELKNKRNRKLSFNDVSFSSDILGKAPEKKSSKKSSRNISLEEILDEISKEDNGGKSEAISLGERRNKNKANVPLDNISTSDILENDVGLKEQDVELRDLVELEENSVVGLKTKKKPKAMHETNTGGGGIVNDGERLPEERSKVELKTKRKKKLSLNDASFSSDILGEASEKKSPKKSSRNISLEEIVKEISRDKEKSEANSLDERRKNNKANIPLDNITSDILENVKSRELVEPQFEENSLVGLKTKNKPKAMHETNTGGILNDDEQLPEERSMVELKTKGKKKLSLNDVSFSSDILGETPEKKSSKKRSRNISLEEIVKELSKDNKKKSEAYSLDGRRKKNKANIPLDNIITSDILENDVELREQDVELRELVVPQLEENSLVGLKTKKKPKAMHETSTGGIVNVGEQLPEEHSMVELTTKRKKKLLLNDVSFSSDILGETPEKKSSKKSSRNILSEEIVNKISRDSKEKSEANSLGERRKKNKANIPLDDIITSDILESGLREQDVELGELDEEKLEENSLVGLKTKEKPKAMPESNTGGILNDGLPEEHSMVELKNKRKKKQDRNSCLDETVTNILKEVVEELEEQSQSPKKKKRRARSSKKITNSDIAEECGKQILENSQIESDHKMEEAHNNNISLDEMVTSILDDVIEELQDQSGNSILAEVIEELQQKNRSLIKEDVETVSEEKLPNKSKSKLKKNKKSNLPSKMTHSISENKSEEQPSNESKTKLKKKNKVNTYTTDFSEKDEDIAQVSSKNKRKGKNTGNALDETVTNILDEVVKELQGKSPGKLKSKKAKKNGGNISLDEITEDNLKTGSGFRRRELQNDLSNEIGDILEKVVEEFNSEEKSQVAQKTRRKNKNKSSSDILEMEENSIVNSKKRKHEQKRYSNFVSDNIEEFQENPPIEQKTKGNKNTSNISTDEISTVSDISREENSLVELKCKRKKKETKIPIEEISTLNAIFAEKKHLVELKENSNEISTVSDISTEKKSLVELKTKRKKEKENISADEISPVSDIYQGEITPDELKTKRITAKSNISTEKISTVSDWSIVEKPLVKLETKRKKGAKISTDEISTDISREISDILQNGDEQIPVENTQTPTRKKRKQKANSLDEAVARMLEKPDSNKATVDIENEVNSQVGKKVERKKKESASLEDKEDEHEQETSLNKSIKNSQKQDKTPNHKDSENNVLLNEKTTSDMESSGSPIKVHGKQVEKTHSSDMEEKVAKVAREIVTTAFSDSDSSDYSMDPKEMNRTISNKMKSKSKDADSEKIRNLDIVIPFALPPLHVHLDRPSKPTSYEISACQEFKIKTGPFSEEEDQKIKNNWERFCEQHHLDIEPTAFFRLPHKMAIETKRKFLQYISHGLDDRTPQRVHHRFKTLFGNSAKKTGRFSNEEDEQILEFMEMTNSNKPYADLSEILDRPSNSIQRRYNLLKRQTGTDRENREKISWTPSKADKLIRRMLKVCRLEKVEQLRDAKITAEQWNKLALKMGDMPIKNLRSAWKITIYPRLFASTDDLARIKKSLLDILYERKETDWRLVDWKDISKQYSGFSPEKLYMMFKKLVLFNVPKLLQKDIQKSIEYLLKGRISKTHKFRRYTFKNGHLVYDDESDDNDFTM